MAEWYVVRLPKGVEFTHIKKEKDCQGRLILIYEEDGEEPVSYTHLTLPTKA